MKSLDTFTEKQTSDRRVGKVGFGAAHTTNRALSREITDLDIRERLAKHQSLSAGEKALMGSATIAMGSPFLLMGLGAAFAFIDEIDRQKQEEELRLIAEEMGIDTTMSRNILEKALKADANKRSGALSADAMTFKHVRRRRRQDAQVETDKPSSLSAENTMHWSYTVRKFGRNWLEAKKILKRKQFLKDQIEKHRGEIDYATMCRLTAKIEQLDKVLAHMGC